jgi:hypothetical protein
MRRGRRRRRKRSKIIIASETNGITFLSFFVYLLYRGREKKE